MNKVEAVNKSEKILPWVLFKLNGNIYGISCKPVIYLVILGDVSSIPNAPDYVRGISDIQGKLTPLIDLRQLFGLKTVTEEIKEFEELINARKQDHINWLTKLEASVRDKTEFTLTTDPHACAFGKWYDAYQTENLTLKTVLKKVDKPHKIIHSIAIKVKECQEKNDIAGANKIIEAVRANEFTSLLAVLTEIVETFKSIRREIVLVLEGTDGNIGIIVDEAIAVEYLTEIVQEPLVEAKVAEEYFSGIGKRKDGSTVVILNYENIKLQQ